MKGIVAYYSGTGSTRMLARAIARGMNEAMETDVASIKHISPREMAGYDVIGIGAPIWYFREPANVRSFIYNMPGMEGKLAFPFCAHGTAPVGIFYSMVPAMQRKGLTIIGWGDWYGRVEQVLHAVKPYFTDGHPDETDLAEAEAFGREMAHRAVRIAGGETDLVPKIPKGRGADQLFQPPFSRGEELPPPGEEGARRTPPRPGRRIDREKCRYPQCTTCVDNCAVNAIDFSADPPVFRKSCFNCSLCDRLCPEGAVEVEDAGIVPAARTERRIDTAKCTYPGCTLCSDRCPMDAIDLSASPPVFKHSCEGDDLCWVICPKGAIEITNMNVTHDVLYAAAVENRENHAFLKFLADAEARGRFRRLVPMDQVGWDTPVFKNEKLPRFEAEEE